MDCSFHGIQSGQDQPKMKKEEPQEEESRNHNGGGKNQEKIMILYP